MNLNECLSHVYLACERIVNCFHVQRLMIR